MSYLSYGDTACHTALGTRTSSQLPLGVYHNMKVLLTNSLTPGTAFCGMAFVYQEGP